MFSTRARQASSPKSSMLRTPRKRPQYEPTGARSSPPGTKFSCRAAAASPGIHQVAAADRAAVGGNEMIAVPLQDDPWIVFGPSKHRRAEHHLHAMAPVIAHISRSNQAVQLHAAIERRVTRSPLFR